MKPHIQIFMLRYFFFATLNLLFCSISFGQTTLYSNDFESITGDWNVGGDLVPNTWKKDICAGNGLSQSGTTAFYISQGGADAGCGPTGEVQYSYTNSPSGTLQSFAHTQVDATCAGGLQAVFDYRIDGISSEDFAELIYSTNGGGSWTAVGGELINSSGWNTTTINLPALLDFSVFEIGIRFTYNDATINGSPIAIDNFEVIGTDNINPLITCPGTLILHVDASCVAIAEDYTKSMLTLSDNCTDSANIIVTQSIPEFSIVPVVVGDSTLITLTATDEAGNSSQCSFYLLVKDSISPIISFCPADTVIYMDANCEGVIGDYASLVTATDNCTGSLIYTQNPLPGQAVSGQGDTLLITITVTDATANYSQCLLNTVTVDTIVPTIICPGTQIQYGDGNCETILLNYSSLATINDNCVDNSTMFVLQSPVPGSVLSSDQTIILTLTNGVPDANQTCQFTLDFIDTIRPNIICPVPSPVYLNVNCEASIPDYTSALAWSDNCTLSSGDMTFSQSPIGGTLTATNQTIILTATDEAGNSNTCSLNQTVIDTIKPQLTCPGTQTLYMNSSCFATLPDFIPLVSEVENCFFVNPVAFSQSPVAGTTINGTITITITGTDESSNEGTCTFQVEPIDTISPTVTCPTNSTVNTNSGCTYILPDVTSGATFGDNCTPIGSLTVSQNPSIGTVLAVGVHIITITVLDGNGNSANCNYTLTVSDQTIPTVNCPLAQNVSVDANCSAVLPDYTSMVTMSDNCSALGQLTLVQSPTPGSPISGNTSITMTVTDEASNSAVCSFFAVIIDDTDPNMACPSTFEVAINSSCQYLVPDLTGDVTGTDNCSVFSNMTVSQNPIPGSTESGITPVLLTLTDEQGNSATCITTILPDDNEVPMITCPSPAAINNGTNCDLALANYASSALVLDNCSNYSITQNPATGTIVQTGSHIIELEVMDAGGNLASCSFVLDIFETEAPTITCPSNISTCDPVVTYPDPIFNDNCIAILSQTDATGLSSGDLFPIGITTLTYMVNDSSANSQSCSFQVEVLEYPDVATILYDTLSLCQTTSALIEAEAPGSGTGEWSVLSGQANFNNQFANVTGVNNVGVGTNILVWTVSTAACGSTSDTLILILSEAPLPASTLDTLLVCSSATFQLSANVPLYGIGTWTTNLGATINDINLANSSVSNPGYGWNDFIWTITNGSCPSTSDTMHVFATPSGNIAMPDTAICIEDGLITVNGTVPVSNQSVAWLFISGSGEISGVQSPTASIDNIGIGTNILVYQMMHDLCPTTIDTVTIVASLCEDFDPIFPTVITPNLDGKNDLFVINYLEKIYPDCRVIIFNRWGSVIFESVGYEDPWDGTHLGEKLPMGTYFYKIELNDSESTVYTGPISIIH